jgi:hypothetical protein
VGPEPDAGRINNLVADTTAWAVAVTTTKSAAYRLHLAWLYYQGLERLGFAPRHDSFCNAIRGSGIELIEHTCGRGDLQAWVNRFTPNRYEYEWQRAKWEQPDGRPDLETPGLDFVMAITTLLGD